MSDALVPESNVETFAGYAYLSNAVATSATVNQQALTLPNPAKQKAGILGARVNFDNGAVNFGTKTLYWGPTAAVGLTAKSTGTSETTVAGNSITTKPIVFLTGGGQINLDGLNASISGGAAYENFHAQTTFNTSSTSADWAKWAPITLATVGYRVNTKKNVGFQVDISYYNIFESFAVTSIGAVATTTYNQGNRQVYSVTGGATYYF